MRYSRHVALLVVALLTALVPAAYASPPDPTWIGGYWDDDDFDNAVVSIVSACAVAAAPLPAAAAEWACLARIWVREVLFVPAAFRPAGSPRSPPIA